MISSTRMLRVACAGALALSALALPARAAIHYVSPNGTATWSAATNAATPTSLATANANASTADPAALLPGLYSGSIDPANAGAVFFGDATYQNVPVVQSIRVNVKSNVTVKWIDRNGTVYVKGPATRDTIITRSARLTLSGDVYTVLKDVDDSYFEGLGGTSSNGRAAYLMGTDAPAGERIGAVDSLNESKYLERNVFRNCRSFGIAGPGRYAAEMTGVRDCKFYDIDLHLTAGNGSSSLIRFFYHQRNDWLGGGIHGFLTDASADEGNIIFRDFSTLNRFIGTPAAPCTLSIDGVAGAGSSNDGVIMLSNCCTVGLPSQHVRSNEFHWTVFDAGVSGAPYATCGWNGLNNFRFESCLFKSRSSAPAMACNSGTPIENTTFRHCVWYSPGGVAVALDALWSGTNVISQGIVYSATSPGVCGSGWHGVWSMTNPNATSRVDSMLVFNPLASPSQARDTWVGSHQCSAVSGSWRWGDPLFLNTTSAGFNPRVNGGSAAAFGPDGFVGMYPAGPTDGTPPSAILNLTARPPGPGPLFGKPGERDR